MRGSARFTTATGVAGSCFAVITLGALGGVARAQPGIAGAGPPLPTIGAAVASGRLTVYPLLSSASPSPPPPAVIPLDQALASGAAVLHELPDPDVTDDPAADTDAESDGGDESDEGPNGDEETYKELVLENHSDTPVYGLAGTVVEGGNQDRALADDYVVDPHQSLTVHVACVESGREDLSRDGVDTGGRFTTAGVLGDTRARSAIQADDDQEEVWNEVDRVNAANAQTSDTSALAASIDALARPRKGLVGALEGALPSNGQVVGLAWTVDGQVSGVRWFANHALYTQFAPLLLNTAAMEAVTHDAPPVAAPPATASEVTDLVTAVQSRAADEVRGTASAGETELRLVDGAYGVTTVVKPSHAVLSVYVGPR
jgi:hypothetical protein